MMDERSARTVDHESREIGTLFGSEMWWRDHYRDIGTNGYRLRPRYDPDWKPSWKTSGKDFFTTEDGQPTLVDVFPSILCCTPDTDGLHSLVASWDGRDTYQRWETGHAQKSSS